FRTFIAQFFDKGIEGVARLYICLVPHRSSNENETWRQREVLCSDLTKIAGPHRSGVRIRLVVTGNNVESEGYILDRTGKGADVIERARERQDARTRHQSMTRLHREDAAERARSNDRSVRLRPERERHHIGCNSGRGPGR